MTHRRLRRHLAEVHHLPGDYRRWRMDLLVALHEREHQHDLRSLSGAAPSGGQVGADGVPRVGPDRHLTLPSPSVRV